MEVFPAPEPLLRVVFPWCLPIPPCRSYPFRSLRDAGVTLSMGSDWTVAPLDPLDAISVAQRRMDPDAPDERVIPEN